MNERIDISVSAASCYNSKTDFDAEIGFRICGRGGQKVISYHHKTREEAQIAADNYVSKIRQDLTQFFLDKIQELKDAQE